MPDRTIQPRRRDSDTQMVTAVTSQDEPPADRSLRRQAVHACDPSGITPVPVPVPVPLPRPRIPGGCPQQADPSPASCQASRRQLDISLKLTGLGIWSMQLDTGRLWWSDTLYGLHGRDPAHFDPNVDDPPTDADPSQRGPQVLGLVHPQDQPRIRAAYDQLRSSGKPVETTVRIQHPAGAPRYHRIWMDLERGDDGRPVTLWGAALDVTQAEQTLSALHHSQAQVRLAFDEAPIAMLMMALRPDGTWKTLRLNDALRELIDDRGEFSTGWSPAHPPWDDLRWVHPQDVPAARAAIEQLFAQDAPASVSFETRLMANNGRTPQTWVHACMADDSGTKTRIVLFHIVDVSERQEAAERLSLQAMTDPITGLGNRSRCEKHLRERLRWAVPGRRAAGLLLLDLDRFKIVNDSLGHLTGDRLLAQVAHRLTAAAPPGWLVCRLGGDEFAIVMDEAPEAPGLARLADGLCDVLAMPYTLPGQNGLVCTASIGVTRCDDPAGTVEDLFRQADLALYAAKDSGRDTATMFDDALRSRADQRIAAEHRLRSALSAGGVRMYLQPVIDLMTGEMVAAEALARLEHPVEGLLEPSDFIDVAEDTGLILQIDAAICELAVAHLARVDVDPRLRLAVNVSPHTLEQEEYVLRLTAALEEHQVSSDRLLIEVTESSLLDVQGPRAEGLTRLRKLGLRIGIDDFGTGYSALAYLSSFSLDFLKIDRSFVARLGTGTEPDAIVAAIIGLAHAHALVVTAEGVEQPEQAYLLRAMGCDRAQGYLFGRPEAP